MCTVMTTEKLFGRTMDFPPRTPWHLTYLPENFSWQPASRGRVMINHHRILGGMRHFDGHYLIGDGINSAGLLCAELFFPVAASYPPTVYPGTQVLTPQDFIMWVLGKHSSVASLATDLHTVTVLGNQWFDGNYYPFHWLLQDMTGTYLIEPLNGKLHLTRNPVAVLTNTPPLPKQVGWLNQRLGVDSSLFNPQALAAYHGPWPQGGNSVARFQRAALNRWRDCPETVAAMQNFLATVTIPHTPRHQHNYTHYWAVVDRETGNYHFTDLHRHATIKKSLQDLNGPQAITFK